MILEILLFIIGIILLIKGADFLVEGSSKIAQRLGIPTIIIGLTIVSIGTTTPELVINILAAISHNGDIAIGNIIGSNIANILLVLGITSAIYPIKVERTAIWREIPISLLAVIVLFVVSNSFFIDNTARVISRTSGILMVLFFLVFLYYSIQVFKQNRKELKEKVGEPSKKIVKWLMVLGGVVALYLGGKFTVDGAVYLAGTFGVSEFFISTTIIAIGTSLPELITGITAAKRQETGIAVGNVAGANILNIFWVLGITAIIAPIALPSYINVDIAIVGAVTIILLAIIFIGKKREISRFQGIVLILLYLLYLIFSGIRG